MSVTILNNALIKHKLTIIRNKNTNTKDFYQTVNEIGNLMAYEVAKNLPLKDIEIETPICKTIQKEFAKDIVIVPILRAGLGLANGIREMIRESAVGVIGLYRDEQTLEPHEYYAKFPKNLSDSIVIVADPMLATGGSAIAAIDMIKKRGAKFIKFACLVAAPEGVEALSNAHKDIDIFVAALDEKLNEKGYIVPGLGDCGDRLFNTVE